VANFEKKIFAALGGVAQGTSHPPQEQKTPGLNPARVKAL
jgi:hypothetical protein